MEKTKTANKKQIQRKKDSMTKKKSSTTPFLVNIKLIKDVEGAKKVLSKLIRGFVRGEVTDPYTALLKYETPMR